ncbi:MAG: alpha/beta hydrolase [Oscillospiraceae bacterium]|nr:alpha/beta hydrolase [Oscillospiraceae bacterium]
MSSLAWAAAAGGILATGAAASVIGAYTLFNRVIPRQTELRVDISEMADADKWEVYIKSIHAVKEKLLVRPSEHITVKSRDGLTLHGDFFPAERITKRTAILFHGYTSCGMNDCSNMAEYFLERGYNALIVDHRSHGKSEGSYIGFGILDRFDCLKWIEYALDRLGSDSEIVLYGVSMGAATVLMASGLDNFPKNVKAIVSDCAFTSPYDVFKHILIRDYHLPPKPILAINERICRAKAGYGFKDCSTLDAVKKGVCPILFIHGTEDTFVPTVMSEQNYNMCTGEKQLLLIANAGHAASLYENRELYESTVTKFLGQYLPQKEETK